MGDLASQVGMQVPEPQPRSPEEAARKEREPDLYAIMEKAMAFYRAELKKSPRAIDYLKGRGLTGEIAARYRMGYAPDDWQALKGVFPEYEDKSLVEVGLVVQNEGKRYDRFRDRVMFPILSARGAVIGFGGRILDKGEPKYMNSPETPLFEKGRELYGLPRARRDPRGGAGAGGRGLHGRRRARSIRRGERCRDAGDRDHAHPCLKLLRVKSSCSASTATPPGARPPGARSK